jgi:predicted Fe-Mo cluster-binding NifX family protein
MKIAGATIDGIALSQHFGQSKGFVVFDVEGSTVQNRQFRTNNDTPHNQGICNHEGDNSHGSNGPAGIFDLLSGCGVLLCGGMGSGAAQSLLANGIKPVILPVACSADDAVEVYINGNLPAAEPGFCSCKH